MLVGWKINEGDPVAVGDELLEIETSKIANAVEANQGGMLRRRIGQAGETYPCGALIGVIAEAAVSDEAISLFVAEYSAPAVKMRAEASGPELQVAQIQGHALRYLAQGTGGVPVLLIHGFGGDLNAWLFVQPALAADRATYAVDLPGHGASYKDLSAINDFEDIAAVLFAFLESLKVGRAHVVAHSMGAAIALSMARRAGGRIASLTLLAPAGLGAVANPSFIDGLIGAKNRRQLAEVLKMLFADPALVSREMAEDLLKFKRLDGAEAALRRLAELLARENRPMSAALADATVPIQAIWGAADRIVHPPGAGDLPTGVRLTVLEGVGHMPHLERSAQVIELIQTALEH